MKTLADAIAAIEVLQKQVEDLMQLTGGKQRGPKTERPMQEEDAFRVKFGDLKELNHKEAAAELGLSYGQIFSCRGGYTFKHVRADWKPKADAAKESGDA